MNTSSYKSLMFTFSQANPSDEQLLDAMQRLRAVAGRQPFYFTLTLRARQLPRDRQGVEPGMVHLREGKLYTGYAPFSESEKWLDAGVVAEDGSLRVLGGKARPQNKKDFSLILDEPFTPWLAAGTALVLAGAHLLRFARSGRRPAIRFRSALHAGTDAPSELTDPNQCGSRS